MSDLGEYKRCSVCNEYGWENTHKCAQKWEAIRADYHDPEDVDSIPTVYCRGDAESASLLFAELNFGNWDYPREMEIWVRNSPDAEWQKFDVSVESVPSFTATKKEGE